MSASPLPKIGFLGLGAMGARMAARLCAAGADLVVWNRSPEAAAPLVDAGARRADTPRAAAEGRDLVFSMLRDDAASEAVWRAPEQGALAGLGQGAVAIDCSTVTPAGSRRLAEAAAARGAAALDAPVAGSRPQAEAGALIFLVGGPETALAQARPALEAMGGAVHHAGPSGAGAAAKLLVNALFGAQLAAMAELLGLAARLDLDPARAAEILAATPVCSPAAAAAAQAMLARRFAPAFPIDLVVKDFGLIDEAAAAVGAEVPISAAAGAVYRRAAELGWAGENITAVARLRLD